MAPVFTLEARATEVGVAKTVEAATEELEGESVDVGDGATDPGGAEGELVAIAPKPLKTTEGAGS